MILIEYRDWKATISAKFRLVSSIKELVRGVERVSQPETADVREGSIYIKNRHSTLSRLWIVLWRKTKARSGLRTTIDQSDFSFGIVLISSRFSLFTGETKNARKTCYLMRVKLQALPRLRRVCNGDSIPPFLSRSFEAIALSSSTRHFQRTIVSSSLEQRKNCERNSIH